METGSVAVGLEGVGMVVWDLVAGEMVVLDLAGVDLGVAGLEADLGWEAAVTAKADSGLGAVALGSVGADWEVEVAGRADR